MCIEREQKNRKPHKRIAVGVYSPAKTNSHADMLGSVGERTKVYIYIYVKEKTREFYTAAIV